MMNRVVIVGLVLGALAALVAALPAAASPAQKPALPFDSLLSAVGITATISNLTAEPPSTPTGTPTSTPTPTPTLAAPLLSSPANGAIVPEGTDVTFAWYPVPGAVEYMDWMGGEYWSAQPVCGWQTGTTCLIGPWLPPGRKYWMVKARNSLGEESAWSEQWMFTIQPPTPTSTPTRTGTAAATVTNAPTATGTPTATPVSSIWLPIILSNFASNPPTMTPSWTPTNTPSMTPTAPPGYQLRINAGGPDYVDSSGQLWHADQPYSVGSWGWYLQYCNCSGDCSNTYATGWPINNSLDPALYQTERYWCGTGGYTVNLPNGSYNVQLRLAEIYYTHPNNRIFDVVIQGTTVIDNLDLLALAGGFTAYDPTFYNVQVSDGLLHIELVDEGGGAKVNAIYIYGTGGQIGTPTATPTPTDCSAVSQIPLAECQALVALYNSTNGAGWSRPVNWLANNTPCTWYGVTCAAGHVTSLDLNSNQLTGNIPAQLGNLSNLQGLNLQSNQLSGNIPPELGNLANLVRLDLYYNHLSGSIPAQLGNLANLEFLVLNDNQLSGSVPAQLGNLANLEGLDLSWNQLSGELPLSLMNLHLWSFHFEHTSLCEPGDPAFQAWLASIPYLGRTGVTCASGSPTVTATPSSTATPTSIATSTATRTATSTAALTAYPVTFTVYLNDSLVRDGRAKVNLFDYATMQSVSGWTDSNGQVTLNATQGYRFEYTVSFPEHNDWVCQSGNCSVGPQMPNGSSEQIIVYYTGNVTLHIKCEYELANNAGVWRNCDNTWSYSPKINVKDGTADETVTIPHDVAVPANSTATLHVANSWFFGCNYVEYTWTRYKTVASQDGTIEYHYHCDNGYVEWQAQWQPYGGGSNYHAITGTVFNFYNMTTDTSYGCGESGFVDWGGGNDSTYCETSGLAPGYYYITATIPDHPECWASSTQGIYRYYLTSPDWMQHASDSFTFYRYGSPSYCLNEP